MLDVTRILFWFKSLRSIKNKSENIDVKNHKLKVIGKGNKERYTILPDICVKLLRQYYKDKNITYKTGFLFPGFKGEIHIYSGTISNYFTAYAKENNLPNNISFHTLRHSFATYYLMNGGDQFTFHICWCNEIYYNDVTPFLLPKML